jgi:hypothetical protein
MRPSSNPRTAPPQKKDYQVHKCIGNPESEPGLNISPGYKTHSGDNWKKTEHGLQYSRVLGLSGAMMET